MTSREVLADWLRRYPWRGGADVEQLVAAVSRAERDAVVLYLEGDGDTVRAEAIGRGAHVRSGS